jgi:hypothetical protein
MLMFVGGSAPALGPVGGIHWHTSATNIVEYYATDPQRQNIPWVRVTNAAGKATVYRTAEFKREPDPAKIRHMDCIDCLQKTSHLPIPRLEPANSLFALLQNLRLPATALLLVSSLPGRRISTLFPPTSSSTATENGNSLPQHGKLTIPARA